MSICFYLLLFCIKFLNTLSRAERFSAFCPLWHPPRDWNQGVPLFMWLKQDLPRILTDSLEPCHFHRLNRFYKPLPYFRHMLWPGPSAPWLKHLSCIYDLQGSVMPLSILYINQMTLSSVFLNFFFGKFIPATEVGGDRRGLL